MVLVTCAFTMAHVAAFSLFHTISIAVFATELRSSISIPVLTGSSGSKYSQANQDKWVLNKVSQDKSIPRIFLDVGAHDGVSLSNTQKLEENGWRGTCVDPTPSHFHGRKCKLIQKAVANEHVAKRPFSDCRGTAGGPLSGFKDTNKNKGINCKSIHVDQITPTELLVEAGSPSVLGYISLDVEGNEFEFVTAFPWSTTCARLWTIEVYGGEPQKLQKMRDTLASHGCSEDTDNPGMGGPKWMNTLDAHFTCKC